MSFLPDQQVDEIFDELYRKGLGLKNEKNFDKKISNKGITFNPSHVSDYISGKRPIQQWKQISNYPR